MRHVRHLNFVFSPQLSSFLLDHVERVHRVPRDKYERDNPSSTRVRDDDHGGFCRKCLDGLDQGDLGRHLADRHPGLSLELYFIKFVFEEWSAEPEGHRERLKVRMKSAF